MKAFRILVAVSALFFAGLPAFSSTESPASPVAVFVGGSTIRIDRPAGLDCAESAEEWEAFLSLDGGRHYTTRITPHLDLSVGTFEWRLPEISSDDARIMIRVGDERNEKIFELPGRFRIRSRAPQLSPMSALLASDIKRLERGEPARPGDPGVLRWVEGTRSGLGVLSVSAVPLPSMERSPRFLPATDDVAGQCILPAARTLSPPPATAETSHTVPRSFQSRSERTSSSTNLLVRIARLNI